MVEAKRSERWDHTSTIVAAIINTTVTKKSKLVRPEQFHPYKASKHKIGIKLTKETVPALRGLFGLKGTKHVQPTRRQHAHQRHADDEERRPTGR